MKRTIALLLTLVVLCSAVLPYGVIAAEGDTSGIEWTSYHYMDADGNVTADTVIVNEPYIAGVLVSSQGDVHAACAKIRVDADGVELGISADNEELFVWPSDYSLVVNITASSALSESYTGNVKEGSQWITLNTDARDFIVQDMRMLAGETAIEIPDADGGGLAFSVPHDGNFRDVYDMEEARQWYDESGSGNGSADNDNSVTPDFKEAVDGYLGYFQDVAVKVEEAGNYGKVGALDIFFIAGEALGKYEDFQELGESATTQADKDYFETINAKVALYLSTGVLGAYVNAKE